MGIELKPNQEVVDLNLTDIILGFTDTSNPLFEIKFWTVFMWLFIVEIKFKIALTSPIY